MEFDLTQAGNIVVESLAAAGIVNMKTDDFIKVIAESILYLGTWTADQLIEITSQYDILNGLNVATCMQRNCRNCPYEYLRQYWFC